jgi:undecaprenyl-diphosphatase
VENTNHKLAPSLRQLSTACLVFLLGFLIVAFFRTSFHSVDLSVNAWIPSIQTTLMTTIAKGIAVVFDTIILAIISLTISGILFLKNHKALGLLLLGAIGGDALLVSLVKTMAQVARPTNAIFAYAGFSFPSGHSAACIVFGGVLAYFAWRHWQSLSHRVLIALGLSTVAGVVGFDRLYLGVHWVSDVIGGWLLGAFWLSFVVLLFRILHGAGKVESRRFCLVAWVLYFIAIMAVVFVILLGESGLD